MSAEIQVCSHCLRPASLCRDYECDGGLWAPLRLLRACQSLHARWREEREDRKGLALVLLNDEGIAAGERDEALRERDALRTNAAEAIRVAGQQAARVEELEAALRETLHHLTDGPICAFPEQHGSPCACDQGRVEQSARALLAKERAP